MKTIQKIFAFLITAALLLFAAAPVFAAESDDAPDYSALDYLIEGSARTSTFVRAQPVSAGD